MKHLVNIVKEVVGFICRQSGLFLLYRWMFLRNNPVVIVYHDPSVEEFSKHVEFLSRFFTFISYDQVADSLCDGRLGALPPFSLVFSFDDGHASNYQLLDLFKRYNARPIIFMCSAIINTHRHFWWKSGYSKNQSLKKLTSDAMLAILKKTCAYSPEKEYETRQALTAAEIREMLPYILIGSHTRFHPILRACDDEKALDEIANSKRELEQLFEKTVKHFATPNGVADQRERAMIRESGYQTHRSAKFGRITSHSDPFYLHAVEVQHNASLNVLCAEIIGINAFLKTIFGKLYIR